MHSRFHSSPLRSHVTSISPHYSQSCSNSSLFARSHDIIFFVHPLLFTPLTFCLCTACTTEVEISMAFGGKLWPINPVDMNLGTLPTGQCLGGIFDLTQGSDVGTGGGNPNWVVGDTFLVSNFLTCCPLRSQRLLKHKLTNRLNFLCRKTYIQSSGRTHLRSDSLSCLM